MKFSRAHFSVGLSLLALWFGIRAEQKYRALPPLGNRTPERERTLPLLSVIVPARNEEKNLQQLLPRLKNLDYAGAVEIIVVDDHSRDDTRAVAEHFGARVLRVQELPAGWHGKPHACHIGAGAARGEWLLFTDADTLHTADSAAHAVIFARQHALDGLTLFLQQTPRNVLQGAVLSTAFAGLFAGARADKTLMNGQYILLRRDVYFASGGFEAVRAEPLEDLALGNRLRKLGYAFLALRGENAASVCMYADTRQMWHGMTRLGAGSLKWSGSGALVTALFTTALMSPLLVLADVLRGKLHFAWLLLAWLAASASVMPFARRFGSLWFALLAPVGALFVLLAAWWGLLLRVLGRGIHWRGRSV